ncbi:MAG: hypothetical protein JW723_10735 [Bacteroidales bacterium]|nr:hypothetical protein [Bacteroidales bacterium]
MEKKKVVFIRLPAFSVRIILKSFYAKNTLLIGKIWQNIFGVLKEVKENQQHEIFTVKEVIWWLK